MATESRSSIDTAFDKQAGAPFGTWSDVAPADLPAYAASSPSIALSTSAKAERSS